MRERASGGGCATQNTKRCDGIEKSRASNDGQKDLQKAEVEGRGFTCSASQDLWRGDGSSVRTVTT